MTTGTPVVVSRIQNRRGTQQQFDGYIYSIAGPNSVYPLGYTGVGGYGSYPDFTEANYPNVLMPGELALCTDSRRLFIGNSNGEFSDIMLASGDTDLSKLAPTVIPLTATVLPPVSSVPPYVAPPSPWVLIPGLTVSKTPFISFLYSITDVGAPDIGNPRLPGQKYAKNGELLITAIGNQVSLVDTGVDINVYDPVQSPITVNDAAPVLKYNIGPPDISFKVVDNGATMSVWYMHDFTVPASPGEWTGQVPAGPPYSVPSVPPVNYGQPITLTFAINEMSWKPLIA